MKIKKCIKHIKHNILKWHNCEGGNKTFDGVSFHSTCSCGKRVMLDSQGNWFEY